MTALWKHGFEPIDGGVFEPGMHADVVVVGAGITGLATALDLVRAGRDVALVERGGVAELASGSNTGKVSLLQGTTLSGIRRHHPASLVRAYVDANRDGFAWIARVADELGVPTTARAAVTYAQSPEGSASVEDEHEAAREAGLGTRFVDADELAALPFPARRAVVLDEQLALDPARLAAALARAFVAAGGRLYTGVAVRRVRALPSPRIETDEGEMAAEHIVLATGTPITDRGLYFAKVSGMRSAAVSFRFDGLLPEGMYLSADSPTHSIRPVAETDGPADVAQLVVGGAGHPVGRASSEAAMLDDLARWAREIFPGAVETHRWSAQDYVSHNRIPFVGAMPRSLGRIRFATGYAKWGLTNGPAAALRIVAELNGIRRRERPRWMTVIGTRLTVPADLARGAAENAGVGVAATRGWLAAERRPVPVPQPEEGRGTVAQRGGRPVGVSTSDGVTRAVDAVCPHLGGVLEWNDLECTWDCPLHASRFAADGTRLEGPARADLRRLG